MSESHGVGFVAHAYALQSTTLRVVEGVANDPLDSLPGVHVFLDGDLVRCALLEEAADANVQPFRVLAKHHYADVSFGAVAQRCQPVVKQFDGACINVKIELKAQ